MTVTDRQTNTHPEVQHKRLRSYPQSIASQGLHSVVCGYVNVKALMCEAAIFFFFSDLAPVAPKKVEY